MYTLTLRNNGVHAVRIEGRLDGEKVNYTVAAHEQVPLSLDAPDFWLIALDADGQPLATHSSVIENWQSMMTTPGYSPHSGVGYLVEPDE